MFCFVLFSSSHDEHLEKGISFGNYTVIKQAYYSLGRIRDKMLGCELVKVSCTMFSWTLEKTEHTDFAFLNSEAKAEVACALLAN